MIKEEKLLWRKAVHFWSLKDNSFVIWTFVKAIQKKGYEKKQNGNQQRSITIWLDYVTNGLITIPIR